MIGNSYRMPSISKETAYMGQVFFALCKAVDSPVSLASWALYKLGTQEGFSQLAEKRIHPRDYTSCDAFENDYLVTSFLSKWKGLETGIDTDAVALENFASSERQCAETNHKLRGVCNGTIKTDPAVEPILTLATAKIAQILGECKFHRALKRGGWGKGATATLKGAEANLVQKIAPEGAFSVTRNALPLAKAVIESDPHWLAALTGGIPEGPITPVVKHTDFGPVKELVGPCSLLSSNFAVVDYNRIVVVPKDARKGRTIAAEPTLNVFLQLGVGGYIRNRLKRFGVDLDDQTVNQEGARIGSINDQLATLDLKSASDTVSRELVYQLLPLEWFDLLDRLRSPKGKLPSGELVTYEKFSSMGNGFTFELESLIFYAIAVSVLQHLGLEGRALVYGDDIVLPRDACPLFTRVLEYCGFSLNPEKSFTHGPFRESCGEHYWAGRNVTPVYQKEGILDKRGKPLLQEAYRLANRLIRLAYRRGSSAYLDRKLYGAWDQARRTYNLLRPKHYLPLDAEDDDGLLLPREEWVLRHGLLENWILKFPVYSFQPKTVWVHPSWQGSLYSYWLRFHPEEGFEGLIGIGRRGYYASRRRTYSISTPYVAWL